MLSTLTEFEREYPEVTFALKSNRAARRILNRAKVVLERHREKSFVLRDDLKELKHMLFQMTKDVVYAPKTRRMIDDIPKILEHSEWVRNSDMVKEIFENHVMCSFKTGQIIQKAGEPHQCVYIVAAGIVKIIGKKTEPVSHSSELYNKLPNTDSYLWFEDETEIKDYAMISQTIGLLGYLQKTNAVTTAVCEKDCHLIQINYEVLNNSVQRYDIIYSMWKSVAIKVAATVLKRQPRYMDEPDEEIYMRLHHGIMADMRHVTAWDVPSIIDDMVIVQGRAKDVNSPARFIGPAYIPGAYRSLLLMEDVRKRPPTVIILLQHDMYHFDVCHHWIPIEAIKTTGVCGIHN